MVKIRKILIQCSNIRGKEIVELEIKEKIENIETRLDSILEILIALQIMDQQLDEFSAIKVADYLELPIEALTEIKQQIKAF